MATLSLRSARERLGQPSAPRGTASESVGIANQLYLPSRVSGHVDPIQSCPDIL